MTTHETNINAAISDYFDNADYAEDDSVTKARTFQTACRKLLLMPSAAEQGGSAKIAFSIESVRGELANVTSWLAGHPDNVDGGGVHQCSFRNLRG